MSAPRAARGAVVRRYGVPKPPLDRRAALVIFLRSMDLSDLPELTSGFVTLLLLPTLGVIGLMNRRALPVLAWTVVAWGVLGGLALYTHHTLIWSRNRFLHGWALGLGLGTGFLVIAFLYADKRIKPWIRVGLALVTVVVFARSVLEFLERYA